MEFSGIVTSTDKLRCKVVKELDVALLQLLVSPLLLGLPISVCTRILCRNGDGGASRPTVNWKEAGSSVAGSSGPELSEGRRVIAAAAGVGDCWDGCICRRGTALGPNSCDTIAGTMGVIAAEDRFGEKVFFVMLVFFSMSHISHFKRVTGLL